VTKVFEDEVIAFDLYFGSIAAFQYHPGSGTRDHVPLSLEDCRDSALRMIELRREVLYRGEE